MVYITGDTHRDYRRVAAFCDTVGSTKEDILIILGDAGINYFGKEKDDILKQQLSELPITLFCIHGNHEQRPESIFTYKETNWHGGKVVLKQNIRRFCLQRTASFTSSPVKAVLQSAARTVLISLFALRIIGAGGRMNSRQQK